MASEAYERRWEKVVDKDVVSAAMVDCVWSNPEDVVPSITKAAVEGTLDAVVLDGVLTVEECNQLIEKTEKIGYTFWDPSENAKADFRSAFTVEVMHPELADRIWERIKGFVCSSLELSEDDHRAEREITGRWDAYGVNPHLLFGRYRDGGHFGPHSDGHTHFDVNHKTLYTVLVYLRDTDEGGETLLLKEDQREQTPLRNEHGQMVSDPANVIAAVKPKAGRVLIFYSTDMHEARGVGPNAEKYILRTDILYRRNPEILTAEEDKKAYQMWMDSQLLAEKGEVKEAASLFHDFMKVSPGLAKLLGVL